MSAKLQPQSSEQNILDNLILYMREYYLKDETEILLELNGELKSYNDIKDKIQISAIELVKNVRANRKRFGGLDSFLQKFGLDTDEGIALMCLAEALLRIPDSTTADRLIRDKIGSANWDKHVGSGDDLFVNASTWALMLTGKVVANIPEIREGDKKPSDILSSMISRLGEPVVRQAMLHAMKILGKQFVMGRNIKEALNRAKSEEKMGYRYSYDMLGEGARTKEDAKKYLDAYKSALITIGENASKSEKNSPITSAGISVKLSAIYPRYEYSKQDLCVLELTKSVKELCLLAAKYNIGLTIDAEEARRLEISLEIIKNIYLDVEIAQTAWTGLGLAVQAYQKRAFKLIDWLEALVKTGEEIYGSIRPLMVRLVKGAYWDSEIKHFQELGEEGYPVFTRKHATDMSYIACAKKLLDRRDLFYPQFATHNAHSLATIVEMAGDSKAGFEFQRLHGMGEPLFHQIVGHKGEAGKYPVRIYAPVGSHEDLLPYLVRRLLENGANSSFVNRLQDDKVPVEEITKDPILYMREVDFKPHPKIPLPANIYGKDRRNSKGIEVADTRIEPLLEDINSYMNKMSYIASPIIDGQYRYDKNSAFINVTNPANHSEVIGKFVVASKKDMQDAVNIAEEFFPTWCNTDVEKRAVTLIKMADLLEQNRAELIALCIKEAGKTIPDAVAELREAVDFCRYYANEAKNLMAEPISLTGPTGEDNHLILQGRGVFLCISPWNFPLAIFLGQVSAALVCGNCVIAKPAMQTSLIAMRAVELFLEAGIPPKALMLIPADGKETGEILVANSKIAGVVFTGSTNTAWTINKILAARENAPIVPLIAETGGQNAMIVDSSALPEQVVDDVITSAFGSAGQRCSALRVLFLQEEIADKIITMLNGAMQEIIISNPAELKTDIGPVIDKMAMDRLQSHIDKMKKEAKILTELKIAEKLKNNATFIPPIVFEIEDINILQEENFGPILHVIRYSAKDLDKILTSINDIGFGLTLGVHTRVEHSMRYIIAKTNVGNNYVNRSMIGAVVGVQPFGGQGLSGTGPKAGGPHYLTRFVTEKTVTINTTASGGNTTLVSLSEDE